MYIEYKWIYVGVFSEAMAALDRTLDLLCRSFHIKHTQRERETQNKTK